MAFTDWRQDGDRAILAPVRTDEIDSNLSHGGVAQWLEHRTHKPGVSGSNPLAATIPLMLRVYLQTIHI